MGVEQDMSFCTNNEHYNTPIPLVAVYIAGPSALCMLAMFKDTLDGLKGRMLWFPCKYFSLNATTLTLLAIATKLPLDLSSPMPSHMDQLSKLTGTVFMCVSMSFFMPSLGLMATEELLSNMAALCISVLTIIGNMCTQFGTGVIFSFRIEHALVLLCMLLLLALMCSSALASDTVRQILNKGNGYDGPPKLESADIEHIKGDMTKVWLLAHTSSPQYVQARSVLSVAAGTLTVLCVFMLIEAIVRSFFFIEFCPGQSDYKWGNWSVVVSQTFAVLVAGIAPAIRWFNAIRYSKARSVSDKYFEVEGYWIERLEEWKESSLPFHIKNQALRRRVHKFRNYAIDICICLQRGIVKASKVIQVISVGLIRFCVRLVELRPFDGNSMNSMMDSLGSFANSLSFRKPLTFETEEQGGEVGRTSIGHGSSSGLGREIGKYVMHLEGEDDMVLYMSSSSRKDMVRWIEKGTKEKCGALLELLGRATVFEASPKKCFLGVRNFDNPDVEPVPTHDSNIPPNCWTLPAVTLLAIATSISTEGGVQIMAQGLWEGLELMKFVEKGLDMRGLGNMRKAAMLVWSSIDLRGKWLDHSLQDIASEENELDLAYAIEIIQKLTDIGKSKVKNDLASLEPKNWPPEALAGNCLYRIGRTITEHMVFHTKDELMKWIESTLADIVGACLTNLPCAIFVEYMTGTAAERESRVRNAAFLLGKSKNLVHPLLWSSFKVPEFDTADIDEWREGVVNPYKDSCRSAEGSPTYEINHD